MANARCCSHLLADLVRMAEILGISRQKALAG
jgi:hypothetical protein